uniref:Uncharacterized protein AlNc14C162G7806 n=1 Tax=Albugo laibachii Nc14 TaxID=890382 RepID=F0WMX1_9STRA|nr:conserved hypothetical protein [Albugo laibachii Nc14]|eukprot:CCA22656.1 conserved hypothetical protein [Albugo laibachii Nc14]
MTGKGKNIHLIACVSENGLEYNESRFGSFNAVNCNALVEFLLRHIAQSHDLSKVVLVVDNVPCPNTSRISRATMSLLLHHLEVGPELPDAQFNRDCVLDVQ